MQRIKERRNHTRIDLSVPLRYTELGAGPRLPRGTLTKNLSAGGTRFVVDRFVSLEERLVVEVKLPTTPKLLRAISKVVWIRKLPTGELYEVGNKFLNISREDKELIAEFAEKNKA